jgi:hypothetical protein
MAQANRLIRAAVLVSTLIPPLIAGGDEPLHLRIDPLIAAKAEGRPTSPLADDAEFLRRVYLDLAGRIPSSQEVREFLNESAPDKRGRLIDRLLAGPDYPRRMQELANVMLMERRGDNPDWLAYLKTSFEANKPFDQLVREILNPDAKNEATRGAGFFYSKRLEKYGENPVDYPGLTRDVGRLFLGVDLQCAQCHDHLFVSDYKQADFQGLFAFFQNTFLRQDGKNPAVGEKVMTQKLEFQSVFKKEKKETGPRVPGKDEIEIPTFPKGEEFAESPDKKTNSPGVPKFSALAKLAEQLPAADNAAFTRNLANRIWFVMMGRGLVHPLDLHHSENPASHPELLELLARELVAHRFDVKWLLRELALSQTYQRSSRLPDGVDDSPPELFLVANEKYMSAEQLLWSVLQATGRDATSDPGAPGLLPAGMTLEKLREKFVKAFANPPGDPEGDFAPSLRASLFVLNDVAVLDCLKPQPGNLTDRLAKLPDAAAVADELYLSVLSRRLTTEEAADVAAHLAKHSEHRGNAVSRLIWGLLASTEFCVNH